MPLESTKSLFGIRLIPEKIILSVLLYLAVLGPYRLAQEFPLFEAQQLHEGMVDTHIPFSPAFATVYLSLLLFMPLAALWVNERRVLACYTLGVLIQSIIANFCFFFLPTAVPRRDYSCGSCVYDLVLLFDPSTRNSAPSLHASLAVFTLLWVLLECGFLSRIVGARVLVSVWCLGILYSTIATRQHVFFDIVTGAGLGGFAYWLAPHLLRIWTERKVK